MTKWLTHQFFHNENGIFGSFIEADIDNSVNAFHMAFAANIVAIDTASFAVFFFVTDETFHLNILFQIFDWSFTD